VRVLWTHIASYVTLEGARAGRRRSIARRELLPKPKPLIVKIGGVFVLEGMAVVGPWGSRRTTGGWRDCLVGQPVGLGRRAVVGAPC
jgi:hypothetical protein